jgi:intein/homing endonuclease
MVYILGFTFADGSLYKTSLSWDIQKRDLNILQKINNALDSTYPISNRKNSYRLRISNQVFINGAINKGLFPKKKFRNELPQIPDKLVRHFVRGYLDGDGWIIHRTGRNEIDLGFVSGNEEFLTHLRNKIFNRLDIYSKVRRKSKTTPHGVKSVTFLIEYYSTNAVEVAEWLYGDLDGGDIYLERKFLKYLEAVEIYNKHLARYRGKRQVCKELGESLRNIMLNLSKKRGLNGMQIARELNTSKSSAYRWLEITGVKYLN